MLKTVELRCIVGQTPPISWHIDDPYQKLDAVGFHLSSSFIVAERNGCQSDGITQASSVCLCSSSPECSSKACLCHDTHRHRKSIYNHQARARSLQAMKLQNQSIWSLPGSCQFMCRAFIIEGLRTTSHHCTTSTAITQLGSCHKDQSRRTRIPAQPCCHCVKDSQSPEAIQPSLNAVMEAHLLYLHNLSLCNTVAVISSGLAVVGAFGTAIIAVGRC